MSQKISVEELVLGYCREVEGLVEPPAYGSHEVLLPDEVAERWKTPSHQRLAFTAETENAAYIHFGHALVETIVDEVRSKVANGRFFINHVRPEKPKLFEMAEKAIALPNAKMFPIPGAMEKITLHHYVRLNFKVSLIADEKRELILPLWMDLQAGFAVNGAEIERAAFLDEENQFPNTPPASLLWSSQAPLSAQALTALLDRARLSAAFELGETLSTLRKRLLRFLELDQARLNDYYDELIKDTQRRLSKADEERRPGLEAKLSAITTERQLKLADIEQKYHLHIQLELINLAVIAQPKLDLMVEIRRRGSGLKRRVSWDPLLHAIEGLACDVCARSSRSLVLCENGHLAHAECLAPQCVDCKRVFCGQCASEVKTCAVCERPVCVHSLHRCKECGRATCQEHIGACHAESGQPQKNLRAQAVEQTGNSQQESESSSKRPEKAGAQKSSAPKASARSLRPSARQSQTDQLEVKGATLEVYSDPEENVIVAYVKAKKHEIATREWAMNAEGIEVTCWCEKPGCDKRGLFYRPFGVDRLAAQILNLVEEFAREYGVPDLKITFFHVREGKPFKESKLRLPSQWRDPANLETAQSGFDALRLRNRGRA